MNNMSANSNSGYGLTLQGCRYNGHLIPFGHSSHISKCKVWDTSGYMYNRVYQNLATSSENYRTFPKVGPHYKEKACKFLARSDHSLRPNSYVLFEIFVARCKISTAQ